ncbi:MAG: hypothetical protein ACXVO9_07455, partial [Bacteroidia bacterium]
MKIIVKFLLIVLTISSVVNAQTIHHELKANIDVAATAIDVIDSIKIPSRYHKNGKDTFAFYLNAALTVRSLNPVLKITEIKEKKTDTIGGLETKKYMVLFSKTEQNGFTLPLKYSGKITGEIKTGAAETARGFSETQGIISTEGIYLANSTVWVPYFNEDLFTFDLTASIDSAWSIVSQGSRTKNVITKNKKIIRYECADPADEVYLIAAKWTEYSKKTENIFVQAMLRSPDSALAYKYINATEG